MAVRQRFEFGGGAVGQQPALGNDHRPAAHGMDLFEDVGGNHDGLVRRHLLDHLAYMVFLVRIEAVGRFVQDQHVRIVQQGLGQAHPPGKALGQGLDRLIEHGGKLRHLDDPAHGLRPAGAAQAPARADEIQKAARRHVGIERRALRQIADAGLGRDGGVPDIVAADDGGARRRRQEAGDHLHGCRLPGAVRAEETENLALRHRE